ncbi:hypothetical protein I317_00708 [Kwoniella heveanensis CBS 569]|uniref:Uncharacterized protein n=1 Tax=Kwoniella heveanensis BCC8398 TaxID=1296120 RepID=A0A1B9GZV1_9TREE|nr:hypothetical protein I316_01801 [Kwoniella heveanensis BCC8398]OCF45461.1 hypothetical protein I317_00708 [Kwoniella heveanensis CBS 569]
MASQPSPSPARSHATIDGITAVAAPTLFYPTLDTETGTLGSPTFSACLSTGKAFSLQPLPAEPTYEEEGAEGTLPPSSVVFEYQSLNQGDGDGDRDGHGRPPPTGSDWGRARYKFDLDTHTARLNQYLLRQTPSQGQGQGQSQSCGIAAQTKTETNEAHLEGQGQNPLHLAVLSPKQRRGAAFSASTGNLVHVASLATEQELLDSATCPIDQRDIVIEQGALYKGQRGTFVSYTSAPALSQQSKIQLPGSVDDDEDSAGVGASAGSTSKGVQLSGLPPSQLTYDSTTRTAHGLGTTSDSVSGSTPSPPRRPISTSWIPKVPGTGL